MGRPRVSDTDRRIIQVNIRLTESENAKVNEYASSAGLSPANWIRRKVFTEKFPPMKLSPLDASIYAELRRMGVNLNQATRKLNQGEMPKIYLRLQFELIKLLNRILKVLLGDRDSDQR